MIALAGDVLLDKLTPETRRWLASVARRSSYRNREVIHKRGDSDPTMGVVVSGKVRLFRVHADGTQTYVSSIYPGQHFGDVLSIHRSAQTHDAVAVGATEIDHYDRKAFEALQARPEIVRALYEVTADRLISFMAFCDDLRGLPREVHLAKVLLHLGRSSPEKNSIVCVQEDLAAFLGTSVMTLAKSIALLRREGMIETGYRRIRICDPARMYAWMKERSPD